MKKFGWDFSKSCIENMVFSVGSFGGCVCVPKDLKRLVESHELVEECGGLDRVKKALDGKHIGYTHFYLHSNDRYVFLDHYVDFIPDHAQHIGMFNKAIADVESCQ